MANTLSGNWSAVYVSGTTEYTSGGTYVSGPVELIGSYTVLTVDSGAVVSGAYNPASSTTGRYISVTVLDGGQVDSSTFNEVIATVSSGGSISSDTFTNCSIYLQGGSASDIVVSNGFFLTASSGSVVNSGSIYSGVTATASAGSVFSSLRVASGGSAVASSGGLMTEASLYSGASARILTGGAINNSVISGTLTAGAGGNSPAQTALASGDAIGSGGIINVVGGGVTSGTVIFTGGTENVLNDYNTQAYDTVVDFGGTLNVSNNAAAYNTSAVGGSAFIYSGGVEYALNGSDSGVTAINQGRISVQSGGYAASDTATSSGYIGVAGGSGSSVATTLSATLVSGAWEDIGHDNQGNRNGSGVASATQIGNGSYDVVYGGGSAISTTVSSGGWERIQNGGITSDTTILTGGSANISSGGTENDATVGGIDTVGNGGNTPAGTSILSGGQIVSGGTVNVAGGGVTSNLTVGNGGTENVNNDYNTQAVSTTVTSGGLVNVNNNATSYDTVVSSGGSANVFGGGKEIVSNGVGSGVTANGGTILVQSGGTAYGETTTNGGYMTIVGGSGSAVATSISAVVSSGTRVDVGYYYPNGPNGSGVASATQIMSGGAQYIYGSANTTGTNIFYGGNEGVLGGGSSTSATIQSGGTQTVSANGSAFETDILSGGTGIEYQSAGLSSAYMVSGSYIEVAYQGFNSGASATIDPNSDVMTVYNGGKTTTIQLAGNYVTDGKTDDVLVSRASDGNTLVQLICYLAGTKLRTPDGETSVEDIRIGDILQTFDPTTGRTSSRPVIWAGAKHMQVHAGLAHDEAGYPVRILKDAIAEGVPHKDLLVTPEHCLFLEGRFVPARMLVNGSSIVYDTTITAYDYFHVETEKHAIIWADGLLSETYLDTGNRPSFTQTGTIAALGGRSLTWAEDAAAPLDVSRTFVEPLHRQIAARAASLGLDVITDAALTQDADLHLLTEDGRVLRPSRVTENRAMFLIPENVSTVRLRSRTARPSDTIGPFVDDRRTLGVLVGSATLFDPHRTTDLTAHLTDANASGWSAIEAPDMRWTTGDAVLSLGARGAEGAGLLALHILQAGPYLVAGDPAVACQAA